VEVEVAATLLLLLSGLLLLVVEVGDPCRAD
jgi:hypothetical protein